MEDIFAVADSSLIVLKAHSTGGKTPDLEGWGLWLMGLGFQPFKQRDSHDWNTQTTV